MTSKAHVEFDAIGFGVRIALMRESGTMRELIQWGEQSATTYDVREGPATEADDSAWLRLREDDARALYDALADHFGHAGHDTRALRKDYDAERARVDKLLSHLTGGQR